MNYSNIKLADVGNGPGVRVSLFASGCNHDCPGCFNQLALDFKAGKKFTQETIDTILNELSKEYVTGLSLLGGEPLDPANQPRIHELIKQVREQFGNKKNIWIWTGYLYEHDFIEGGRAYSDVIEDILLNTDVLVDGPFVMTKLDASINFRGSSNQRIIDLNKTRSTGELSIHDIQLSELKKEQ